MDTPIPADLDAPIPAELVDEPPVDPADLDLYLDRLHMGYGETFDALAAGDMDVAELRTEQAEVAERLLAVHRWRPGDDGAAEWVARLRAAAAREEAAAREQADIWREQINRWEARRVAEPQRTQAWATGVLVDYGAGERTAGGRKQVALPSAIIATRAKNVGGRVDIADEEAVIAWAEDLSTEDYEAVIKTTRKVVLAEFRKRVRIREGVANPENPDDPAPLVVVDEAGTVVPGVTVTPESFDVSVR